MKFVPAVTPPPGVGVLTVTVPAPAVAMSAAVIAAVSRVALTNVVVRGAPFHSTAEEFTKPVPSTVSVNAALPATALVGERFEIVGVGFGAWMVKLVPDDVPPPGAGRTYRYRRSTAGSDIGCRDRRGELGRTHKRSRPRRAVPLNRRCTHKS